MGDLVIPFIAGLLTTLSPCVLPILPFVTASSIGKNKFGPLALSFGLLVTFVSTSLLLAISGKVLGLDATLLKKIAGVGLLFSGLLFLFPILSEKFTSLFSSSIQGANKASQKKYSNPLITEFMSGIFLGVVWAPCSGPSLGAAISLAAQTDTINRAFVILSIFGLGAIIPMIAISYGARGLLKNVKQNSSKLNIIKKVFGSLMATFGLLVLTGFDKAVEAWLLNLMPQGWIEIITKF